MGSSGWKHLRELQDATRDGYNNLSSRGKNSDNSLMQELVVDLFLIGIGLASYIQLDIKPFLPFSLPEVIQAGPFTPILAMAGLALVAFGGVRMLFALFEALAWLIGGFFKRRSGIN